MGCSHNLLDTITNIIAQRPVSTIILKIPGKSELRRKTGAATMDPADVEPVDPGKQTIACS
jgi:hypothetical protein